jgi:hypothetical protein
MLQGDLVPVKDCSRLRTCGFSPSSAMIVPMKNLLLAGLSVAVVAQLASFAQTRRAASPAGASSSQVGGAPFDARQGFVNGKWLEIRYGRPIKRGRDLFGLSDYADFLNDGAPVWRAGANQTTRLNTEAPLLIGNRTIPAGEYSIFIDLQPKAWLFVVSSWPAQTTYDEKNKAALWGAYDYTPDKDLIRVPMTRGKLPYSFDQFSWQFVDVTATGGKLAMLWDREIASVAFEIRP